MNWIEDLKKTEEMKSPKISVS
ncbi:hypothetical protein C5167_002933 [Papaver somniferum]|uniref:Uncharacterized protein n=1 Tax=Papaver somniferum TaxID=3469 RepID=A0A4Y7L0N4_PAPSO|nr:hypothetical protein C5167_002933 [Papaver somniferum]